MMNDTTTEQIHATCIAIDGAGVLLRGASGSGKSDLALRLMDRGAHLVADDRVHLTRHENFIIAGVPDTIAGMIEARGVGIVDALPHVEARLRLVIDLVPRDDVPRLPEPENARILGCDIALLRLHAFDASTPIKIRLALDGVSGAKVPAP